MKEMFVYMHITGKITGENHQYFPIQKKCATIGGQRILSLPTRMDAIWSIDVIIATDGKNKNSILITLKLNLAYTETHVKSLIALITIVKQIENIHSLNGLDISLKQELFAFQQTFMYQF